MRLVAALTLTASVALGATAPVQAVEKTVHIPIMHCDVTVMTSDFTVTFHHGSRRVERWGHNGVETNC